LPKNLSITLQTLVLAAVLSSPAFAKTTKGEAPAPPAVPVPKVDAEALVPPGPTKLEGTAQVVDGDEIRIGDSLVRLYGIAAPELSGRQGPEARVALDELVGGQRVNCQIFGKTAQGDAIGQCLAGSADPAETLLSRGLAAVYRSGNVNDQLQQSFAAKYDAAETRARKEAVGLWQPPAPPPDPTIAAQERDRTRVLGIAAFALLILSVLAIPITRLSIARRDRTDRAKLRAEQRTALSFAMAAEVEIVLATTRRLIEQIAALPGDRPVPGAIGAALALPSTTFWNANPDRLHLLPVEVTVPLLRFHAQYEDAARKLAVANALPSSALAVALTNLVEFATAAVAAIESSLGITRPSEPATKPTPTPAAESAQKSSGPQSSVQKSSELSTAPGAATN
jgi:endonuclease YncB( thermonuclease family)